MHYDLEKDAAFCYTCTSAEIKELKTIYRNKEQFIICFRWVDKGFNTHEDFIGIYNVDNLKADTLVTTIKDVLIRLHIPLSNARG